MSAVHLNGQRYNLYAIKYTTRIVGAHTSTIGGANQEQSNGLPETVKDHTVLNQIHESVTQGTDYKNRDCSVMVLVTDSDHNIPIGSHVKLNNFPIFSSTNESNMFFLNITIEPKQ